MRIWSSWHSWHGMLGGSGEQSGKESSGENDDAVYTIANCALPKCIVFDSKEMPCSTLC